jgi:glutaminyl-peptide cyclotransferase
VRDLGAQVANRGLLAICATVLAFTACKREPGPAAARETAAAETPVPADLPLASTPKPSTNVPVSTAPPPREIWKEFSGEKAFAEVKKQVDLGPRPAGSAELEQARIAIVTALENFGWEAERQEFSDTTPRGSMKFVNLIARFSSDGARPVPRNTQRAIVCSHYDTKRFSMIRFYGADDGASSTGALVELARVLALDPVLAAKIELVFFDGEEALVQFTETDGLYGSRYYARQLRETGRAAQFQFGILWDMIGDSDLTITLSPDSPVDLTKAILASADALGLREHFSFFERTILDDHYPLNHSKIPTIDLIDFNYPYWHTADDTLVRLSAASLQKVGAVTLHHLRGALNR